MSNDNKKSRDDWYSNTAWSKEIEEEFFVRYKRARPYNRFQYLRFQAQTLFTQNDDALSDVALKLLDRFFQDYTAEGKFDKTGALLLTAEIYDRKKVFNKALEYYAKAADNEEAFPTVDWGAKKAFARFVVVHGIKELFNKAEARVRDEDDDFRFPKEKYQKNSLLAIFEKKKGDIQKALHYKKLADEAAVTTHSGYAYHKNMGLVQDRDGELDKLLNEIENH